MNKNAVLIAILSFSGAISLALRYFAGYYGAGHLLPAGIHIVNAVLFYLLILRLLKSYAAAFCAALPFCVFPFFFFVLDKMSVFAAFFLFFSFYLYTFTNAKGLKHNQDKHFLIISALFFFVGTFFSQAAKLLPFLIFIYELTLFRYKKQKTFINSRLFFKLFPFIAALIIYYAFAFFRR